MNFIPYMSYWGAGYQHSPNKFIINCHKLSAYYLRKNFGEVHFITDTQSIDAFNDIKWNSVSTDLDHINKEYSSVWSLGKLHVYKNLSEKKIPFIHVDYDLILWEGLPDRLKGSSLFAQNYENSGESTYEKYHIEEFLKLCPELDIFKNVDKSINAVNLGIFGGTDFEFINEYSSKAIDFVYDPKNKDFWTKANFFEYWNKAAIVEQYYLSCLLKIKNKEIDGIFNDVHNKFLMKNKGSYWLDMYLNNINFSIDQNDYPYTHLMNCKKRSDIENKVKLLVKKLKL
jgi:hypothetical protein